MIGNITTTTISDEGCDDKGWGEEPISAMPVNDDGGKEAHANIVSNITEDMSGEYDVSDVDILKTMNDKQAETAMSNAGGIESTSFPMAMERWWKTMSQSRGRG